MIDPAPGPARRPRIDPRSAWTVVTDAPLRGCSLAREAGVVLAWDEGDHLYLLGAGGERRATSRAPGKILTGTLSDDGSLIALVGDRSRLWLLGADLETIAERPAPPDPLALAVDSHGRFVAVSSRTNRTQLVNRHGQNVDHFETRQALSHLTFLATKPILLGTAAYGTIARVDLTPEGQGGLRAEVAWQVSLMSNVGRLAATGDGGAILASCFTHGIQRYDLEGRNEGSYHLGGTASHAVPDFAGRSIVVATLEGEIALLNQAGVVRWKSGSPRPAIALEMDALGRYFVFGMATGEVTRIDLEGEPRPAGDSARARPLAPTRPAAGSSVRAPDWSVSVAQTDDQAETAVLTVLDDPPRIGVLTSRNRLQVFKPDGAALGQAPEVAGVGRTLSTSPGWIACATDRMVVLYDARRNGTQRLELSLSELTHLAILPDSFGLAIVQERDRLGRATLDGRWAWHHELDSPVEDLALHPEGLTAVSTEDGRLRVFGPGGEPLAGRPSEGPPEPLLLIEAPEGAPEGLAWITLARRLQVLSGHRRDGRVLWEAPLPWEGWRLQRVGTFALVSAPDGRALAFDAEGSLREPSREGDPQASYGPGPDGRPRRVARQGMHLLCTDLGGHVLWRSIVDAPIGPLALGRPGVAALIGRQLAWFGSADRP